MESLINANEVWGGTSTATTSNDAIKRTGTYKVLVKNYQE